MSHFQELVIKCVKHIFPHYIILIDYRPIWLNGLELDIYISEINLGIECNGQQHYLFLKNFHKSYDDFNQQQYRDKKKIKLCNKNGVKLITFKYSDKSKQICRILNNINLNRNEYAIFPKNLRDEFKKHRRKLLRMNQNQSERKLQKKRETRDS